ncbi:hypothetical protein BN1708_009909 [Verticillium longisporum]|uniref:Uncharacterized protein n=1 Tax=Verticillium longisporum TaxID=100787 RepID=A0A0G4KLZ9_VERLO|nr:hypothetical protein BN1708_009909 [Verticillium longisporum]
MAPCNHGHDALTPSAFSDKIRDHLAKASASNLRGSQSIPRGKDIMSEVDQSHLAACSKGEEPMRCGASLACKLR